MIAQMVLILIVSSVIVPAGSSSEFTDQDLAKMNQTIARLETQFNGTNSESQRIILSLKKEWMNISNILFKNRKRIADLKEIVAELEKEKKSKLQRAKEL